MLSILITGAGLNFAVIGAANQFEAALANVCTKKGALHRCAGLVERASRAKTIMILETNIGDVKPPTCALDAIFPVS
jgi:uncharacterized protein with ATP-grasp and redox domains